MKLKVTTKSIVVLFAVCIFFMAGCSKRIKQETSQAPEIYKNIEFEMAVVQEPLIPDYTVNLENFGAVRGGQVLNTQAFAAAIDAVSKKGGGKVVIPAGIWLTGPIILKSNLELHAEKGALIKFSTDKELYPIIETNFEGLSTFRCLSPVYGKNLENVAFTGNGVWAVQEKFGAR